MIDKTNKISDLELVLKILKCRRENNYCSEKVACGIEGVPYKEYEVAKWWIEEEIKAQEEEKLIKKKKKEDDEYIRKLMEEINRLWEQEEAREEERERMFM